MCHKDLCVLLSRLKSRVSERSINEVVLQIYGDVNCSHEEKRYNFPDFLFEKYPQIIETARRAKLTAEEMDIFGYLYYLHIFNKSTLHEYLFFKTHGGYFNTQNKISNIYKNIGEIKSYSHYLDEKNVSLIDYVYTFGTKNQGSPFSYCNLPKKDIVEMLHKLPHEIKGNNNKEDSISIVDLYHNCKIVEKTTLIGTSKTSYIKENHIGAIVAAHGGHSYYCDEPYTYYIDCNKIQQQCFEIQKIENVDEEYMKRKQQYHSDLEAYNAHPDLYDKAPSFEYQYEYWLQLTDIGRQYIEWYEAK